MGIGFKVGDWEEMAQEEVVEIKEVIENKEEK